jgi:hypothetical protein
MVSTAAAPASIAQVDGSGTATTFHARPYAVSATGVAAVL